MDKIFYGNDEYNRLYEHENGGTYYVSDTAEVVVSWLDVYPNGTVNYVWNGTSRRLGFLDKNCVVKEV